MGRTRARTQRGAAVIGNDACVGTRRCEKRHPRKSASLQAFIDGRRPGMTLMTLFSIWRPISEDTRKKDKAAIEKKRHKRHKRHLRQPSRRISSVALRLDPGPSAMMLERTAAMALKLDRRCPRGWQSPLVRSYPFPPSLLCN